MWIPVRNSSYTELAAFTATAVPVTRGVNVARSLSMAQENISVADDLIRALGELGVAQESGAAADDVFELTEKAIGLKDALIASISVGRSQAEAY